METRYTITLFNKFKHPYYYSKDDELCIQTDMQQYETTSKKTALQIVKDFLDVPEAKMTLDEVRKQFESPSFGEISESRLVAIQNYYNGRLALFEYVKTYLEDEKTLQNVKRFDIPYEYNHFMVYSEDSEEDKEEQLDAYIEIKIDSIEAEKELIDKL